MQKLPTVTEETVNALVGDMIADKGYIAKLATRIAEEQPALAIAISALASQTKDAAMSGGYMCIVYDILDKQRKTDALNNLFAVADDESPPQKELK